MDAIPCFPHTLDLIAQGVFTSITEANKQYVQNFIKFEDNIENDQKEIFYDPQTSGGLLLAVRQIDAQEILKTLYERGVQHARIIGECFETNSPHIQIIQ
jgi:selenide,water dikinase